MRWRSSSSSTWCESDHGTVSTAQASTGIVSPITRGSPISVMMLSSSSAERDAKDVEQDQDPPWGTRPLATGTAVLFPGRDCGCGVVDKRVDVADMRRNSTR
jgi:hypothetical protein